MTPAQKNQMLLEHGFLARVKLWLDDHYPDECEQFLFDNC